MNTNGVGLTERQQTILEFIRLYIEKHGYAPTRNEIASAFEMRQNAANDHLMALQRKGAIRITPQISRGIVLVKQA